MSRIGPKSISDEILDTLQLDAPPCPIDEVILKILVAKPNLTIDPYEKAQSWSDRVLRYLQTHWNDFIENDRQPKIAFNSSSGYMIQGPCFIEPEVDSEEVKEQKRRRVYWKDYYNTLRRLDHKEFEVLCKKMLGLLGVKSPVVTQYSADEGIDFYGHLSLADLLGQGSIFPTFESSLKVWLVGQAKHYVKTKVATPDIRDLVGAVSLGRAKVFGSPKENKYQDLEIRVCDPVFMLFFTTGEISSFGWNLLKRSGVVAMNGEMVAAFLADKKIGIIETGTEVQFNYSEFKQWLVS